MELLGYVWYGWAFQKSWLLLISENKWLKSKAAECLVNWLFIRAVNGKSSGKVFGKLKLACAFCLWNDQFGHEMLFCLNCLVDHHIQDLVKIESYGFVATNWGYSVRTISSAI